MKAGGHHLGHKGPVYTLCQGRETGHFFSGSGDGTVVRWQLNDPENGELVVNVGEAVFSLHLDERNGLMLIGTEGSGLHVVDRQTKKELHLFQIHRKGIFSMIGLPGDRFACAGGDGSISIWKFDQDSEGGTFKLHRQIPLIEEKLRDLALSPDGSKLVVAGGDGTVRLLDIETFNEIATIDAHIGDPAKPSTQGASSVAFHPAKPVLISGGKDGYLRFWRTDKGLQLIHAIPAHKGSIYRIRFNADGTLCATCSRDKTAKIWDPATFDLVHRLDRAAGGHTHSVNAVLWSDQVLITASDDRKVISWDIHG